MIISSVSSINLSRASLALLVAAVLLGGFLLGSTLPELADRTRATPSPTAVAASPGATARPTADVAGEDLARLPRYPGSVRSEFAITVDERYRLTAVEFLADESLDAVRAFYQGVIAQHGWQRADIGYSAGEWTYVLVDGSTEALIEIEELGGLVEIDLQVSEPIASQTPTPEPAQPAPTPTIAPVAPPPPPPGDDDDDDDADDSVGEGGGTDDDD